MFIVLFVAVGVVALGGWWGAAYLIVGGVTSFLDYWLWWKPIMEESQSLARGLVDHVVDGTGTPEQLEAVTAEVMKVWRGTTRSRRYLQIFLWPTPFFWRAVLRPVAILLSSIVGAPPGQQAVTMAAMDGLSIIVSDGVLMERIIRRVQLREERAQFPSRLG